MKKSNRRTPLVFHVAVLLLCLTLVSAYMTGGMFARYTSSASGSDSARVAKFDVQISNLSSLEFDLNSFDQNALTAQSSFTVTSNSEVAVEYGVVITLPEALPSWLTMTVDGNSPTVNGSVYTFNSVGSFAPGTGLSDTHTLELAVAAGLQSKDISMSDVTVEITVRQID